MGYELNIPLKVGTLEIEFDTVAELERNLARLDVSRVERAVLAALHGNPSGGGRKARKKGKKKGRRKKR